MHKLASITPATPARAAAASAAQVVSVKRLFHPVEHAILRQFFKRPPLKDAPQDLAQPEDAAWVGIDRDLDSEVALPNAVARLCLGPIQSRLPQWGCTRADGTVVFGRAFHARSEREVEAIPVYLFTLNWADSGPGMSWPVAYHATWVPGYSRWVVTASADGTDAWGCEDLAVGWFRGTDIVRGAGRVIRREWRAAYRGWDQAPWAYLFGSGLVSDEEAQRWRGRVWRGHEDVGG